MRTLALVLLLAAVGCGSETPPDPIQPPIDEAVIRDGQTLVCLGASEACSPLGTPLSCTCTWSCISWHGINHTSISFTFTRALPTDPWPEMYTYAMGRPGTCD